MSGLPTTMDTLLCTWLAPGGMTLLAQASIVSRRASDTPAIVEQLVKAGAPLNSTNRFLTFRRRAVKPIVFSGSCGRHFTSV